jgi:hypothetical protein
MSFHLIGGSPSSGSTLLADLLDSTDISSVGPELEFFCNRKIYDFSNFKKNPTQTSELIALRSTGIYFKKEALDKYGCDSTQWDQWTQESKTLTEFTEKFSKNFIKTRNKNATGIVLEKTPQNINAIELFLKEFETGYFINIVRNPLNVFESLQKRGWGELTSWATWLIYQTKMSPYLNHPRVITVKYEDLIKAPFEETAMILNKINGQEIISTAEVENGFKTNAYRSNISSVSTWNNVDRTVVNSTQKKVKQRTTDLISSQLNCTISSEYAKTYDLKPITLKTCLEVLEYPEIIKFLNEASPIRPKVDLKDLKKITIKWAKGVKAGHYNTGDIKALLNPIGR